MERKYTVLSAGTLLLVCTGLYLGFTMASSLLTGSMENPLALHGILIAAEVGCFLLPPLIWSWIRKMPARVLWRRCTAAQIALAIVMALCGYLVADFIQVAWTLLLGALGMPALSGGLPSISTPGQLALGFVSIALSAAVSEEVLFRGTLLPALAARNRKKALIVTAVAFMLMHSTVQQMPYTFLYGLLLGWLTLRSGSIWPSMAYHATNNAIPVIIQYFYGLAPVAQWLEKLGQSNVAQDSTTAMLSALPVLGMITMPLALGVAGLLWAFHRTSPPAPVPEPSAAVRPWHYAPLAVSFVLLTGLLVYNTLSSLGLLAF